MTHTNIRTIVAVAIIALMWGCKPKTATPEPVEEKGADEQETPAGAKDETAEQAQEEAAEEQTPTTGKRVVMVIACKDFRDEELQTPQKILDDAGHEVIVASTATQGCTGMKGAQVDPDMLIENVVADEYDAMVFVGGTGSAKYYDDEQVLELARESEKQGLIVAAICLAPGILARAGILEGRKATAYDDEMTRKAFEEGGADYTGSKVTVDGVIVTGNGPEAAEAFGDKLAEMLK